MVQIENTRQRVIKVLRQWKTEQWLLCLLATRRGKKVSTIFNVRPGRKRSVGQSKDGHYLPVAKKACQSLARAPMNDAKVQSLGEDYAEADDAIGTYD